MDPGYEILVHFDEFRNIDLFRQGLYYLRVYCYQVDDPGEALAQGEMAQKSAGKQNGDEKPVLKKTDTALWDGRDDEALPYNVIQSEFLGFSKSGLLTKSQSSLLPAQVDSRNCCFCTRAFRIQYIEQIVHLNEGCQFRLGLGISKMKRANVYMDVELMFAEFHSSEYARGKHLPVFDDFFPVCRKSYRLAKINSENIDYFFPLTLDDAHFCLISTSVHTSLLNFQVRSKSSDHGLEEILFPIRRKDSESNSPIQVDPLTHNYSQEELTKISDEHHQFYMNSLIKSFNSLRESFQRLDSFVTKDKPSEIPELVLESDMTTVPFTSGTFPRLCKLTERLPAKLSCTLVADKMLQDLSFISAQIFHLLQKFMDLYPSVSSLMAGPLLQQWKEDIREYWGACIFRETLSVHDRAKIMEEHNLELHSHVSQVVKTTSQIHSMYPMPVEDIVLKNSEEQFVVIFEQTYNKGVDLEDGGDFDDEDDDRKSVDKDDLFQLPSEQFSQVSEEEDDDEVVNEQGSSLSRLSASSPTRRLLKSKRVDHGHELLSQIQKSVESGRLSIRSTKSFHRGKHLFVFLHGYQGNSWDMRTFRNHLAVMYPSSVSLLSTCNEGMTEHNIEEMGRRLANEVDEFIQRTFAGSDQVLGRISFVAHSLGGVIVRAALLQSKMSGYLDRLYTFFSLGSPHCGYLFSDNVLLNTGIWFLRKWYKSVCLEQLSLTDASDPRDSFMYRLSSGVGLGYFRNVLLVSSPADRYAPYHSVRMEMHSLAGKDNKWGPVYEEMVRNLLCQLEKVNFTRFDVCFLHNKTTLDSMIGRAAHIYFLDQPLYIMMLLVVYQEYFA